jgi:uncharacterized protein (TIGR03086 family)
MEPLDALTIASTTFTSVLDLVRPDQLDAATPCEDWDVRGLLTHVLIGDQMTEALLDGASQEEAMALWGREFGGDLVDLCRASVADQLTRMRAVDDWDLVVHHLVGDVPASQLVQFRTGDLTVHAWDLATAIGADVDLPDDLALRIYESMLPMAPFIGEIGIFGSGPSGTVPDDAPITLRLLDFTGRRP